MNTLSKEKTFDYESKELLGLMCFDFYDGRLSNQWNARELIKDLNDRKNFFNILYIKSNK